MAPPSLCQCLLGSKFFHKCTKAVSRIDFRAKQLDLDSYIEIPLLFDPCLLWRAVTELLLCLLERSLDVRPHSAVDVLFQFWDNTLECPFHSTGAVVVHPDGQPMERHALLLRMADLQQNQMVLNKKS